MAQRKSKKTSSTNSGTAAQSDAVELLKAEHKKVLDAAKGLEKFTPSDESLEKLRQFGAMWLRLADLEAELVFPKLEEADVDSAALEDAMIGADVVALLLADLVARDPGDPMFAAVLRSLLQHIIKLIELEENEPNGIFAKAKKAGVDLKDLGSSLVARMSEAEYLAEESDRRPRPRHLRSGASSRVKENYDMRGNERERDERGRFVEDDDHRGGRSSGSRGYSRSRSDDDYDDRRSYRSRGRDDDDDRRGWYGDSRGHAEAARRGWDERRGGRQDYDDDRRRSRYDDDDDRRGRRRGGWFGDSEGHAEASRRGWDNPDHGPSGWYGDSEGHSRAAQRGWDNPDHGPSGWFGDSEGHSRASQRGWEGRRGSQSSRYDDDDDYDRRRRR